MLRRHARLTLVHDNHWATDSAAIAGDKNGSMMVIDVHAHEFADASCSAEFSKVIHEATWIAG